MWWRVGGSLRGAAAVGARWARCPLSAFPLGMSALGTPGCPVPAPRGPVAECALGPQSSRPYLLRAPGFLRLARPQNQILSLTVLRKPFSTELLQSDIFALLIENRTRTQLGPLRSPVRRLHASVACGLSSPSPAGPLPSKRPPRASTPQSGLLTDFTPSEAELLGMPRPGRTPPAALPSCSLRSRHSFNSTPSSHTRAHGASGPAAACPPRPVSRTGCWSRKDV